MSIHEVTTDEVVQQCARCGSENRIPLDTLAVGAARGDRADETVVPLPPCPTCSSSEFLIRSALDEPDHPAPGSVGHLHRMLVDHVHAELVKREKVIPQLLDGKGKPRKDLARPVSPDAVTRWFVKGMKIAPQTGTANAAEPEKEREP